jgi:cell division protein ZapB
VIALGFGTGGRLPSQLTKASAGLTRRRDGAYRGRMDQPALDQLRSLAARVHELVDRCQRLADENRSLRMQQEQLAGERSQLLAKNEQARSRVEAMITRLKSLEQHT